MHYSDCHAGARGAWVLLDKTGRVTAALVWEGEA